MEFPVVSAFRATHPSRDIYAPIMASRSRGSFGSDGIVKFDTTSNKVVGVGQFGEGLKGGEGSFVPRCEREEDMKGGLLAGVVAGQGMVG